MKRYLKYIFLLIFLILLANALFVVNETEQVIITQFGEPVGDAIQSAGLHLKIPFIQKTHFFDKRILEWDGEPNQIPTSDKKFIWVDSFVRWRIFDPLLFYQTNKTETFGHSRLDDIIDGVTRDIITKNELFEIVRNSNRKLEFSIDFDIDSYEEIKASINVGREKIADSIYVSSYESLKEYGIELVDVKIKRVNYIDTVRRQVYERMISERNKIAEKYRSAGQGRAAEIKGKLQKDLNEIESEAYREAQEIMGEADAEAIEIYANAYNKDPEFYGFTRSLEAYQKTISENNILILTTDSEFFKYLKKVK
ncbi:MAG: protease modulator HflC [Candidatus Cloacimonetes bacterium]|nr:protease modulator HflC [Candidatus Cloacimonadota bacterium]